ncbi:MAG TPA: DUF2769 domain-containing protein [Candidatus Nanoarchaeia archaeon]|nr:DUF2769 domain-containing protein [Candidatus Nanoarchaeia archaeon]
MKNTKIVAEKKIELPEPICICPTCPTFIDCDKKAFCLTDKSINCIKKSRGCLCQTGCPVAVKHNFKKMYYCIKGSDAKQ